MRLSIAVKLITSALIILAVVPVTAQVVTNTGVTVEPFRGANVRSGPGVNYDVIATLQQEQVVAATGRSDSFSNWLQVDLGGRRGWVAYFTVAVTGDVNSLPILTVSAPLVTATPTPEQPHQEATSDLYVTAFRRVNVRTGPGTGFSVMGVLAPGQTADIIGTSGATNDWLQVNYNGEPGWIAYFVVTISGDVSQLDVDGVSTLPDADETHSDDDDVGLTLNQVVVVTRFNTNLRTAPILGSDVISIVPYETTVQALERTDDNRWLRVRHGDDVGWLITSLVNTQVAEIEALPTIPGDTP